MGKTTTGKVVQFEATAVDVRKKFKLPDDAKLLVHMGTSTIELTASDSIRAVFVAQVKKRAPREVKPKVEQGPPKKK